MKFGLTIPLIIFATAGCHTCPNYPPRDDWPYAADGKLARNLPTANAAPARAAEAQDKRSYWLRELALARARRAEAEQALNVALDDEVFCQLKLREFDR